MVLMVSAQGFTVLLGILGVGDIKCLPQWGSGTTQILLFIITIFKEQRKLVS